MELVVKYPCLLDLVTLPRGGVVPVFHIPDL